MIFMFGGFIWLMLKYGWTGRGDAASVHGHEIDWLLNLNFIIIVAVFFITNALLFLFAFKYVKKPGVKAFYFHTTTNWRCYGQLFQRVYWL